MKTWIAAIVPALVMTGGVSAECIDVPVTRLADTAEILTLARVDAAPNPPSARGLWQLLTPAPTSRISSRGRSW